MPAQPRLLRESRLCIVGLGLMGGSLALALQGRAAALSAGDSDEAVCSTALQRGIVAQASPDLVLAAQADIVILATPVQTIIRLLAELGGRLKPGTMLMDLGSVKTPIVEAMDRLPDTLQAIGGHPMCGKATAGLAHADPDLFQHAAFVLCATRRTSDACLSLATEIVSALGARAVEMDGARHDAIVATVSGLPYCLSAALAYTAGLRAQDEPAVWSLAASGFRDTSRLAGTDPTVMADILLSNAPAILADVAMAQAVLSELASLVRAGDHEPLRLYLRQVQAYRHAWENESALP
jgi:prephenate dehydrogenase